MKYFIIGYTLFFIAISGLIAYSYQLAVSLANSQIAQKERTYCQGNFDWYSTKYPKDIQSQALYWHIQLIDLER